MDGVIVPETMVDDLGKKFLRVEFHVKDKGDGTGKQIITMQFSHWIETTPAVYDFCKRCLKAFADAMDARTEEEIIPLRADLKKFLELPEE